MVFSDFSNIFLSIFLFFFSHRNFIYFTKNGDHNISSHFYTKFGYIVFFPIFYSIFVQLFERLSELYFLQLYIFGKLWMFSFHRFLPCEIWSYGHQDIASRGEVMKCKKLCDVFLKKFIPFQSMVDIIEPFLWEVLKT